MIRPPIHRSLAVLHQEILPAFQSDLFPIGLGRRRVALFRISDCNIFLTMSSWHLLRLTSLIKFAHVEVNNLDIRVSGSSRLIFDLLLWFKLGKFIKYKQNYTGIMQCHFDYVCLELLEHLAVSDVFPLVLHFNSSPNMRIPRLYFLCVSWWRCQASQLWWCGLHFQRQLQWFPAVTRAKLWHQPLSHLRVQRRK